MIPWSGSTGVGFLIFKTAEPPKLLALFPIDFRCQCETRRCEQFRVTSRPRCAANKPMAKETGPTTRGGRMPLALAVVVGGEDFLAAGLLLPPQHSLPAWTGLAFSCLTATPDI